MENPYAAPGAAQSDGTLGVDDVQLRRQNPHPDPSHGVFSAALEKVKKRPVETILLSVLSGIFGNGRCQSNIPSNLGDLGSTGGYEDDVDWGGGGGYDDSYEYFTDIDPQAMVDMIPGADMFGLPSLIGQMGGMELGIILGVLAAFVVIGGIMFVIGVALQAAEDIYWLRMIRGQNEDLGRSFSVGKYILPIIVAQILVTLGTLFGLVLLIIPGIILAIGWTFVGIVAVDKNLGYVDAVKASWRITDGYKLDLFVIGLLSGLVNLVGLLACCVGVFVSMAVVQGAYVIFYDRIAEPGNSYLQPGESTGTGWVQDNGGPIGGGPGGFDSPGGQQPPPNDDPYGAQW